LGLGFKAYVEGAHDAVPDEPPLEEPDAALD
jgi:hypothetical protein